VTMHATSETAAAGASARELARLSGGEYVRLPRPEPTAISGAVKARLEAV
jgi:hypothetical protein